MKKSTLIIIVGGLFLIIGISPLLAFQNFQLGMELGWFGLGLLWILTGLSLQKKSIYRPFDKLILTWVIIYLLGIIYMILLRPLTWSKNLSILDQPISEKMLLSLAVFLSFLVTINHYLYKRRKNTITPLKKR